jgi:peptide/nickel transport system substrate-binding protein
MRFDENGELEGRLAENWEHSQDFRTWTIHLNKNARWHDGESFTAHDVKFTLDLLSHPDVHRHSPDYHSIKILDDYTYEITHHQRFYSSMQEWNIFHPQHLLENLDPKEFCSWEFWTHPVGNGPYRFVRVVPKTMVELEANPDYYLSRPRIERVKLKFGSRVLTELLSGNVDAAVNVRAIDVLKIAKNPEFKAYFEIVSHNGIYWNQNREKFKDTRVRQAISLAIDRKELHEVLNFPQDFPYPDRPCWKRLLQHGQLTEAYEYDPELAEDLLTQSGWIDEDRDGILEKNGMEFRFTGISRSYNQSEAIYVQDQLHRIGIQMEISVLDTNLIKEKIGAGDFEAVFFYKDWGHIDKYFGEDSVIGYHNEHLFNLFEAEHNTMDPVERNRIILEAWAILKRDQPFTFLHNTFGTHIVHRRIRGLKSPLKANPILNMSGLWIEDED